MKYSVLFLLLFAHQICGQVFSLTDRAFVNSTSPLRTGLVGYWRMEESSGVRYDASRFGNHLTDSNGVTQTTGIVGNCAVFDGVAKYLSIADNSNLSVASDTSFTFVFWAKRNSTSTSQVVIWKGTNPGFITTWEYQVLYNGAWSIYVSNGSQSVVASKTASATNVWDFVVADYDAVTKYVSIQVNNGTKSYVSSTHGSQDTSGTFYIGTDSSSGFYSGSLDEVGFWKRSLTDQERCQLYNTGLGNHYPFTTSSSSRVSGGSSATGVTAISPGNRSRLTRPMRVTGVTARIANPGPSSGFKWKIFRPNPESSNYDFVGESELFTASTYNQTFTFASPIAAREGDCIGVWLKGGTLVSSAIGTYAKSFSTFSFPWCGYSAGDIAATDSFATSQTNALFDVAPTTDTVPVVVFGGDSIMAGANGTLGWVPFVGDTGCSGRLTNSIPGYANATGAWTNAYLNCCISGASFSTVINNELRFMVEATTASNSVWILHSGVNDINLGRTWAAVSNDLNTISAAAPVTTKIYLDEIIPWTGGTDLQALTIRIFNTNYAVWCVLHGATLIPCHDNMGTNRVSTGFLDDMKSEYKNADNLHLSSLGVTNMVVILKSGVPQLLP